MLNNKYETAHTMLGGAQYANPSKPTNVMMGDSAFLWQDPSELDVKTPKGWWADGPAQVGFGLGALVLVGAAAWWLAKRK